MNSDRLPRALAVAALLAFITGCGGGGGTASMPATTAPTHHSMSDSAMGMPGESAMGMPGESAMGMPGAQFACTGLPTTGSASCTVAINLNVRPLPNPSQPSALIPGLHPADLQNAYALPSQDAGGLVAIVDAYDNPAAESDLAVYRTGFGLPACTTGNGCFRKVNQRGAAGSYPAPNTGWSQEISLDLDMVSAVCPRCSIILVEADSALLDDLGAAVDTAAALGALAVSNSYYAIEWSGETGEDVHYRHSGVAITASSGDRGYQTYPAASRFVTSVGGTTLTQGAGGWTESAWQYGGHGCSLYVSRPSWQTPVGCDSMRSGVDVAAIADPQTGVATFDAETGGWQVAGGTSVGAPIIAAAYALSGRFVGPSYSYSHAYAFNVLGGGFTLATGLGSPKGVAGL